MLHQLIEAGRCAVRNGLSPEKPGLQGVRERYEASLDNLRVLIITGDQERSTWHMPASYPAGLGRARGM